jgi:hypothetical protein
LTLIFEPVRAGTGRRREWEPAAGCDAARLHGSRRIAGWLKRDTIAPMPPFVGKPQANAVFGIVVIARSKSGVSVSY